MDEEQSTKRFQKTKLALRAIGVAAGAVLAAPVLWGMYAYGKTTELVFKTTQTAFEHPWVTASLLAGGVFYTVNAGEIHDRMQEYSTTAQQSIAEYRIDALSEKVAVLEQKNQILRKIEGRTVTNAPPYQTLPVPLLEQRLKRTVTNEDFYLGLATGAGGTLLGLGGYAYITRPRKKIRVVR